MFTLTPRNNKLTTSVSLESIEMKVIFKQSNIINLTYFLLLHGALEPSCIRIIKINIDEYEIACSEKTSLLIRMLFLSRIQLCTLQE